MPNFNTEPFPIGIYQLNNLVENRVPFVLLHFQVAFEEYFKTLQMHHIRRVAVEVPDVANILEWFSEMKWGKDQALVLVCKTGETSLNWAKKFSDLGYINVYYLEQGWTVQSTVSKG